MFTETAEPRTSIADRYERPGITIQTASGGYTLTYARGRTQYPYNQAHPIVTMPLKLNGARATLRDPLGGLQIFERGDHTVIYIQYVLLEEESTTTVWDKVTLTESGLIIETDDFPPLPNTVKAAAVAVLLALVIGFLCGLCW